MNAKSQIILLTLIILVIFTGGLWAQEDNQVYVTAVEWSPDGSRIALAMQNGAIQILDSRDGTLNLTLQQSNMTPVHTLIWSPDGTQIASGGADTVAIIWDVESGQIVHSLQGHVGQIRSLTWSADSAFLATASQDGFPENVHVWDVLSGQIVFSPIVGDVLSVAWSPDGTTLAISKFGEIQLWDISRQQIIRTIVTPEFVVAIAWSSDGTHLASADTYTPDSSVTRVWDVATSRLLYTLEGHTDVITSVRWSPTGEQLVTASHDQTIRIWNVSSGPAIRTYQMNDSVFAATFSPYGGRLALGNSAPVNDTISVEEGEIIQTFADGVIQIVVPAPSLELLIIIAELCVRDALILTPEITDLPAYPLTEATLSEFIAQVEALPDDAIPSACRADLLAVAEALQQGE